jgi:hypothetical protein
VDWASCGGCCTFLRTAVNLAGTNIFRFCLRDISTPRQAISPLPTKKAPLGCATNIFALAKLATLVAAHRIPALGIRNVLEEQVVGCPLF